MEEGHLNNNHHDQDHYNEINVEEVSFEMDEEEEEEAEEAVPFSIVSGMLSMMLKQQHPELVPVEIRQVRPGEGQVVVRRATPEEMQKNIEDAKKAPANALHLPPGVGGAMGAMGIIGGIGAMGPFDDATLAFLAHQALAQQEKRAKKAQSEQQTPSRQEEEHNPIAFTLSPPNPRADGNNVVGVKRGEDLLFYCSQTPIPMFNAKNTHTEPQKNQGRKHRSPRSTYKKTYRSEREK